MSEAVPVEPTDPEVPLEGPEHEPETEPEPEPETETAEPSDPEHETEPVPPESRCEAEVTMSGTPYRCALSEGHDGEHAFQPLDTAQPQARDAAKEHAKRLDALEREAMRHANRVKEIMGADANDLVACALCPPNIPGWRFDHAPDPATTHAVRAVLGLPDLSNYHASTTESVCNDCGGLGLVLTGSQVAGRETLRCDGCQGKGYTVTRSRMAELPDEPEPSANGHADVVVPIDGVKRDAYGTPEGDPDYGLLPNLRQRPVDYWLSQKT